jgi:hypothetical protein
MRHPDFLPAMGLAALMAAAVLSAAVAPAIAMTRAEFEAVRGRYELSDGREMHVGGTLRRPSVVIGTSPAVALAAARDSRLGSADGRLELHFAVQPNGVVTGVRVTQRP